MSKTKQNTPNLRQALAVIASVMRFGNTEGIPENVDYFKEFEEKMGVEDYIQSQFDAILEANHDLFESEMDYLDLREEIKGDTVQYLAIRLSTPAATQKLAEQLYYDFNLPVYYEDLEPWVQEGAFNIMVEANLDVFNVADKEVYIEGLNEAVITLQTKDISYMNKVSGKRPEGFDKRMVF